MDKNMKQEFINVYGEGGEVIEFFSPGRVNLIEALFDSRSHVHLVPN